MATDLEPSAAPAPDVSATDALVGLTVASVSPAKQAYRRFLTHKGAVLSTFVLAVLIVVVVLAPWTARYGVNEPVIKISEGKNQFLPPSKIAWFGTDDIGRDLFSRIIYGMRVSLFLGFIASLFSVAIGALIGAVAGIKGGLFDDIVMRVTDIFLAFPLLVSLLVMRNVLGALKWLKPLTGPVGSIRFLIVLFVIFGWMGIARLVRAQVMSFKEREFIEAARAIGASNTRIVLRHMIPNTTGPLLVSLSLGIVGVIVGETTLAIFGYGPQPGAGRTSLGVLVGDAKGAVKAGYWWLVVYPIGALLLITLCISFIGDGLRDATDPKFTAEGK